MKIELVNGSTIETVESKDVVKGRRAKWYEFLNVFDYRELTKEEEDVIKSFINPNVEWKTEYESIWVSSNESE